MNGTEFNHNCTHCGSHNQKHINRLHAEANKTLILIITAVSVVAIIALWNQGYISKLVLLAPIWFGFSEQSRASKFNKVLID